MVPASTTIDSNTKINLGLLVAGVVAFATFVWRTAEINTKTEFTNDSIKRVESNVDKMTALLGEVARSQTILSKDMESLAKENAAIRLEVEALKTKVPK